MDPLQTIAAGTIANDGTGDSLRVAAQKANTNFGIIALNDTQGTTTLTGTKIWDGVLTKSVEFNDIATLTLDAATLNLSGVGNVSIASTGAGASQGEVEIRADQQLTILTPAVVAQTATVGQVLQLTDAVNGVVEFADTGGGGSFLPLAGGTMSGSIAMGAQKITGLGAPTSTTDASTKLYVDQVYNTSEPVTYSGGASTTINNLNPGSTTANRIVFTSTTGSAEFITVTGIVAPTYANKTLIITNTNSVPLVFSPQDTGSTAANRFVALINANSTGSADMTLGPMDSGLFVYNSSSSRWGFLGRIQLGNLTFASTTSGGVVVDAINYIRPGGQFEFVTAAAYQFRALRALSSTTSTLMVELFNKTGGSITINYDAATPTATDGILTPSGANVTWPNLTAARFAYDRAVTRWRLLNTPQ
jgi:hypothetical protein